MAGDADDAESVDSLLPWFGPSAHARAITELESEGFCVLRGVLADECARELALWDLSRRPRRTCAATTALMVPATDGGDDDPWPRTAGRAFATCSRLTRRAGCSPTCARRSPARGRPAVRHGGAAPRRRLLVRKPVGGGGRGRAARRRRQLAARRRAAARCTGGGGRAIRVRRRAARQRRRPLRPARRARACVQARPRSSTRGRTTAVSPAGRARIARTARCCGTWRGRHDWAPLTDAELARLAAGGAAPGRAVRARRRARARRRIVLWRSDLCPGWPSKAPRCTTFRAVACCCMLPAALTPPTSPRASSTRTARCAQATARRIAAWHAPKAERGGGGRAGCGADGAAASRRAAGGRTCGRAAAALVAPGRALRARTARPRRTVRRRELGAASAVRAAGRGQRAVRRVCARDQATARGVRWKLGSGAVCPELGRPEPDAPWIAMHSFFRHHRLLSDRCSRASGQGRTAGAAHARGARAGRHRSCSRRVGPRVRGRRIRERGERGCVGGFGLDEMVNKAGGPLLRIARQALGGCSTGGAKCTPSFAHARTASIIHAVRPVYRVNRLKRVRRNRRARGRAHARPRPPPRRCAPRRARSRGRGARAPSASASERGRFRGARASPIWARRARAPRTRGSRAHDS